MKRITRLLLLSALILIIFSAFPKASSTPTRRIYLEPSNIEFPETTPLGTKFNVTVWCEVETGVDIGGAQIHLEFDDGIINVTRWICPHGDPQFFMPEPPLATELPPSPEVFYAHTPLGYGYIEIAVMKGGLPPGPPWGHSGKIAIIEFIITKTPPPVLSCILNINSKWTYLQDSENNEISNVVKENGVYTIIPEFSALIATLALISLAAIVILFRKKALLSA